MATTPYQHEDTQPYSTPQGALPPPGEHPRKGGGRKKALIVAAVVVVAAGAWIGYTRATAGPVHAKVGDCVHVAGAQDNPNVSAVDCTDPNADYVVVRVVKGSTDTGACNNIADAALSQRMSGEKLVFCLNKK
ncbi:hypothetical protein ACIQGZ_00685 [Streptomyces sp. NPDC092296]|uniref:LppU/SCO3897 family protein n=1 Tax=Streptomyces sp. NPDC092296 TaxID=3366012 RepID=UPI003822693F